MAVLCVNVFYCIASVGVCSPALVQYSTEYVARAGGAPPLTLCTDSCALFSVVERRRRARSFLRGVHCTYSVYATSLAPPILYCIYRGAFPLPPRARALLFVSRPCHFSFCSSLLLLCSSLLLRCTSTRVTWRASARSSVLFCALHSCGRARPQHEHLVNSTVLYIFCIATCDYLIASALNARADDTANARRLRRKRAPRQSDRHYSTTPVK